MIEEELFAALDGLFAYDTGSHDSGIHDEELRARVLQHLTNLSPDESRITLSRFARSFLTDEQLEKRYGFEDVLAFFSWLDGQLPYQIWGRHL